MNELLLSSDEIDEYLISSGGTIKCPMCAHDEWSIPSDPERAKTGSVDAILIPTVRLFCDPAALIGAHIESWALVCTTCGFIRLQALQSLRRWLDDRKEARK